MVRGRERDRERGKERLVVRGFERERHWVRGLEMRKKEI